MAYRATPVVIGAFFLLAAFAKALSVGSFITTIQFLTPFLNQSRSEAMPLASAIILWEAALGWCLLIGFALRWALILTALTLTVFTAVLIRLLLAGDAPSCSCTGAIRLFNALSASTPLGIARNLVFLGGISWVLSEWSRSRLLARS